MRSKKHWLLLPSILLLGFAFFLLFTLNRRSYTLIHKDRKQRSAGQTQISYPTVIGPDTTAHVKVTVYVETPNSPGADTQDLSIRAALWNSQVELSPPSGNQESYVSLAHQGDVIERTWTWSAKPRGQGNYFFVVKTSADHLSEQLFEHVHTFEITVIDLYGLNLLQARVVGLIIGLLGLTLFVPGLKTLWGHIKAENNSQSPKRIG